MDSEENELFWFFYQRDKIVLDNGGGIVVLAKRIQRIVRIQHNL